MSASTVSILNVALTLLSVVILTMLWGARPARGPWLMPGLLIVWAVLGLVVATFDVDRWSGTSGFIAGIGFAMGVSELHERYVIKRRSERRDR